MPRTARQTPAGYVYHLINRGVGRMSLFAKDADYAAFESILADTQQKIPLRLISYCMMPNHWHLVVWPSQDDQLARFMQRLTVTHVRRWQEHRHRVGEGHVYQGRYKSFPCQEDDHLVGLCRYVERNALRAGLVERAEDWRWGSLWRWVNRRKVLEDVPVLCDWPTDGAEDGAGRPRNWVQRVNQPENEAELEAIRLSLQRGRPLGNDAWVKRTMIQLGLESTFRPRGRPRNPEVPETPGPRKPRKPRKVESGS